jgi:hypothetical protein
MPDPVFVWTEQHNKWVYHEVGSQNWRLIVWHSTIDDVLLRRDVKAAQQIKTTLGTVPPPLQEFLEAEVGT